MMRSLNKLVLTVLVVSMMSLSLAAASAQSQPSAAPSDAQTASGGRVPLPAPPDMDRYELKFSRPLSEQEQQIWDAAWNDIGESEALYAEEPAKIYYTERAQQKVLSAKDGPDAAQVYPLGDGAPGTILLDTGCVTVCLGEEPLTREAALALVSTVAPAGGYAPNVDYWYSLIYPEFSWVRMLPLEYYTVNRTMLGKGNREPTERLRHEQLTTQYMLHGLRPSQPIPLSETADGSLWYDEAENTFHLPLHYEMTDEELLQYIDKATSLERQSVLGMAPDLMDERQAVAKAREWAQALYGWDVSGLSAFAYLQDGCPDYCPRQPMWSIHFGPEDLLVRSYNQDLSAEECEIQIDARDGALHRAKRNTEFDVPAATDNTVRQIKAELQQKAVALVQSLIADGAKTGQVDFFAYGEDGARAALPNSASAVPQFIYCRVAVPGGAKYQVQHASGNLALISVHYESKDYEEEF